MAKSITKEVLEVSVNEQKPEVETPVEEVVEEVVVEEQQEIITEQVEAEAKVESKATEAKNMQVKKPSAVISTGVRMVKVHALENVNCYIGGAHYLLAKGKEAALPSDVACILANSQKVYRI